MNEKKDGLVSVTKEQLRLVDVYVLKSDEQIVGNGSAILCKNCGGVRYRKEFSRVFKTERWNTNQRVSKDGTIMLTGCACEQKARREARRRRDGYVVEDGSDEKGKITRRTVEGTHSDVIYNTNRYLFSVPEEYRRKWIESSSFWTLKGESAFSYQMVRTLVDMVFFDNEIPSGVLLYGGEKAVAMLCALRNVMLHYGHPCIFMDSKTLLFHMTNNTPMSEEMKSVEVLMINFTEPLSESGSKVVKDLLVERNHQEGKRSFFCTKTDQDTFAGDWVSESLFEQIALAIESLTNMLYVRGENEK